MSAGPIGRDFEASSNVWDGDAVRRHAELYEGSDGALGATLLGFPVVLLTTTGAKSGLSRRTMVMRVEHDGEYALVAAHAGAPTNPVWFGNVVAQPVVHLQDGSSRKRMTARQVHGAERARWWSRALDAYPIFADYQEKTERELPVLVLSSDFSPGVSSNKQK